VGLVSVAIGNGTRKAITRHHAGHARCDRLQSTLKIAAQPAASRGGINGDIVSSEGVEGL